MPMRLASPGPRAVMSTPWWRAKSMVGGCRRKRRPLGAAESSHPVGAGHLGHATERLEVTNQPLEGVLAVHRGGEPPVQVAGRGREWHPAGEPEGTNAHDFADRALGEFAKAIP